MTREEAVRLLKQYQGYEPMEYGQVLRHSFDLTDETVDTLLSALTPPTQEQLERQKGILYGVPSSPSVFPAAPCRRQPGIPMCAILSQAS